ncbi:MAG: hypothetical protein KGZ88_06320 [Methylomicrobium sp.]|nr:hypothetical protein [Methylomicrobium sp.]
MLKAPIVLIGQVIDRNTLVCSRWFLSVVRRELADAGDHERLLRRSETRETMLGHAAALETVV